MSPFKPHFRTFPNGAPYPGTCLRCGNNRDLVELGYIAQHEFGAYYCTRCIAELATNRGFVTSESFASEVSSSQSKISELEAQVNAIPNLIKEFSNDISNIVSNFVVSLASVDVPDQPVQPEGTQADAGEPAAESGSGAKSGKGKKQTSEPSSESAE